MLGGSAPMRVVFDSIRKWPTTDAPVLILGARAALEKRMAAHAIHSRSSRKDNPFIAINCSAIPETLLESELFGHEKGAFTGAHVQRKGRIETANGGTLFLDEIGDGSAARSRSSFFDFFRSRPSSASAAARKSKLTRG